MSQIETLTLEDGTASANDGARIVNDAQTGIVHTAVEVNEASEDDLLGKFGINGTMFIAQLINFLIVLLVLWRFAYKPLMKLMSDRTEKIEKGLKQADEMEQRIQELENEKEKVLSFARLEAKTIVMQASEAGKRKRDEAVANAKAEVEKVVVSGKTQLLAQKEQMMSEVKDEIVALVIASVRKVAGDSVDVAMAEASASSAIEQASKEL